MILSVYLGSGETITPDSDFLIAQLHSLMHKSLSETQRNEWKKDIDRINEYLHESIDRSSTRSYVFFSSGKNLWQIFNFEFFLPPLCKISRERYVEPLKVAIDKYQKYLVLLIDRKKARLFTVNLGKIEEHKDVFDGEVPQDVKAKKIDWGRDDKIFKHIQQHLHYHLQFIAKAALEFAKNKHIHFIVIGGHKEMIPKMKAHLLYPLDKKVVGEFVTELNIPLNKVLLLSEKIAARI